MRNKENIFMTIIVFIAAITFISILGYAFYQLFIV